MLSLKNYLFIILILSSFQEIFCQRKETPESIKKKMWEDPDFSSNDIPEKWKSEAAVILSKSFEYEVKEFMAVVYENTFLHKRIKLLDKSAINFYSQMSFLNDQKLPSKRASNEFLDISVGIKVIKSNGKENTIDLKDAVLTEIKEGSHKVVYKKIAIPNLEIGDIIDYFYVIKSLMSGINISAMEPIYYEFAEEYPIVKQKLNIRILSRLCFNAKSINGAPQLQKNTNENRTSYSVTDQYREKILKPNLWSFPLRLIPVLKFQTIFFIRSLIKYDSYYKIYVNGRKKK